MTPVTAVLEARTATDHFPSIGRYVANLARAMVPLLAEDERLVLLHDPTRPSPWDLTTLAGERVQLVDAPVSPFSLRQQWAIPRLLHRLGADLYHSPYYPMPYWPGVPTVLTVYDLIPLLFPQYVSIQAWLFFRWTTALAVRTAAHVIAISQATQHDLLTFYHLLPEKITVIPLRADPACRPRPPTGVESVRGTYGLPEQYVLYLGINKPHKNLARLIEAWHLIVQSYEHSDAQLIIAGAWDERYPECKQQVKDLDLADRVRFLDFIPDQDLPALYSAAELFVFPSLYERFELPSLEGMACGTPVIASNASSLPEVVEEAGIMVRLHNARALAEAMEQVLMDEGKRREMKGKGLQQAARFSWERAARETLLVYGEVADVRK